jgi:hypothetical protein
MTRLGKDRQARGTICGTVVPHTFQTTVPWNDLRGTVERFCPKFVHQRIFQAIEPASKRQCANRECRGRIPTWRKGERSPA